MVRTDRNDRGISVLEATCSLGFFAVLITLASASIDGAKSISQTAERTFYRHNRITAVHYFLDHSIRAGDTHRLAIPPRVHSNGDLRLPDQSPHPIMAITSATRPKPLSDAISATKVFPGIVLEVENPETTMNDQLINTRACSTLPLPEDQLNSFIGVSKDAISFQIGASTKIDAHCLLIKSFAGNHHLLGQAAGSRGAILTLLPIQSDFAVYVDTKNNLRFVSFMGEQLLENQPIVEGIENLHLRIEHSVEHGSIFYNLTTRTTLTDGFSRKAKFFGRISRHHIWNTLLWSYG